MGFVFLDQPEILRLVETCRRVSLDLLPAHGQVGHCLDVVFVVNLSHLGVSVVVKHCEKARSVRLAVRVDVAVSNAFEVSLDFDAVLAACLDCVVKRHVIGSWVLENEFSNAG